MRIDCYRATVNFCAARGIFFPLPRVSSRLSDDLVVAIAARYGYDPVPPLSRHGVVICRDPQDRIMTGIIHEGRWFLFDGRSLVGRTRSQVLSTLWREPLILGMAHGNE